MIGPIDIATENGIDVLVKIADLVTDNAKLCIDVDFKSFLHLLQKRLLDGAEDTEWKEEGEVPLETSVLISCYHLWLTTGSKDYFESVLEGY